MLAIIVGRDNFLEQESRMYDILNFNVKIIKVVTRMLQIVTVEPLCVGWYTRHFFDIWGKPYNLGKSQVGTSLRSE